MKRHYLTLPAIIIILGTQLHAQAAPPCQDPRSNLEQTTQTISDQCLQVDINAGTLSLSNTPDSFSFPIRFTTSQGNAQPNFSNISGTTGPNGLADPFENTQQNADEDVLTVTDLRNSGGFQVTITADTFTDGINNIPLSNLYAVTTYPTSNDLPAAPDLLGSTQAGITYAQDAYGTQDITNSIDTVAPINQALTFTTYGYSFDPDANGIASPIVLMNTTTPHAGSFSTALSFYLLIPGATPQGTYATMFTIDLMPQ